MLSGATTFLIVVALVLINVLTIYITDRYPVTIDLTPEKVFQLTDQSKEYIAQLSKQVTVQVMTSEENFIAGGEYYVQANAVLKEYEKYSDQITLEYVDLLENPSLAYQYEDVQIGDIVVSCGHGPRRWTPTTCLMLRAAPYYGSYITSSKAEQAMTSAIMNVTSETQVKAAVLSGYGEQSPDGLTALMEDNNFEIVTVSPATEEIPSDVDVLIWMAPTNDPDQEVLDRIDSFLSSNEEKTLLYFADTTQPELPRLESFLEKWGIGVQASSIIETDSQHIINMNPYFSTTSISNLTLTDTMTDTSIPITMRLRGRWSRCMRPTWISAPRCCWNRPTLRPPSPTASPRRSWKTGRRRNTAPLRWQSSPPRALRTGRPARWLPSARRYRSAIRCFPAGRSATRITTFRCSTP